LIERYLPGRELTVGIWGTDARAEVIGSLEVVTRPGAEPNIHSYLNKEQCETLIDYRLASSAGDTLVARAEQLALVAWRHLGCRDAGRVDIRCDESGEPMLLEINALSGLHPTHSDLPILCRRLGIPYLVLIDRIVKSASERLPAPNQPLRKAPQCA
jgi:D-alanine-D-alanine ligase